MNGTLSIQCLLKCTEDGKISWQILQGISSKFPFKKGYFLYAGKKKIPIRNGDFTYCSDCKIWIMRKNCQMANELILKEAFKCQLHHGVSRLMGPKKQGFCSKINCSQMKLLYFVNWHSVEPTKIGHNFRK